MVQHLLCSHGEFLFIAVQDREKTLEDKEKEYSTKEAERQARLNLLDKQISDKKEEMEKVQDQLNTI